MTHCGNGLAVFILDAHDREIDRLEWLATEVALLAWVYNNLSPKNPRVYAETRATEKNTERGYT